MSNISFVRQLKQYRHIISKQTLKTIRGQALAGDAAGAKKGLEKVLSQEVNSKDKMINAHRGVRYMDCKYGDIDYRVQLSLALSK